MEHGYQDQDESGERPHVGVAAEQRGQHPAEGQDHQPAADPHCHAPLDQPSTDLAHPHGVALAEELADHGLASDGHRVEGEGQKAPDLEGDLVRTQVDNPHPGRHRRRPDDGHAQRRGAHQQRSARTGQSADGQASGPQSDTMLPGPAHHPPHIDAGSEPLGDHGGESGRANPEPEAEDQHQLEAQVDRSGHHRHHQGETRVLKAP